MGRISALARYFWILLGDRYKLMDTDAGGGYTLFQVVEQLVYNAAFDAGVVVERVDF
jgi:hypothetical protein